MVLMASTNNHFTSSSGAIELMRQMSSNIPQEYLYDWRLLDSEQEYKPLLHQKRQRIKIPILQQYHRGIGYVQQFHGHKYPIGGNK